jgi:tetratricopeptide (TPR) repeat protein
MHRAIFTAAVLAGAISGCALPVEDADRQNFIPDRELNVVSLVREGLSYYQKNRFVDAEFSFRRALYLYPKAPNIKANLATALRASGQFDEAEDILLSLNAAAPKSIDYLSNLGKLYSDKQEYSAAKRYYAEAFDLALDKEDVVTAARFARNLSAIAFRLGDESAALCHSQLAYTLKPDADGVVRHSRVLLALNQARTAHDLLKGFLNTPGVIHDPSVLHGLAVSTYALGNYKEALELERSVSENSAVEPKVLTEAKVIAALSKRRLHISDASDAEEISEAAKSDSLAAEISNALEATSEKAVLYLPRQILDDLQVVEAEVAAKKAAA